MSNPREAVSLLRQGANVIETQEKRVDFLTQLSQVQGDKLRLVEALLGLHANNPPARGFGISENVGDKHRKIAEELRATAGKIEKALGEVEPKGSSKSNSDEEMAELQIIREVARAKHETEECLQGIRAKARAFQPLSMQERVILSYAQGGAKQYWDIVREKELSAAGNPTAPPGADSTAASPR